jgi:hypothetical protein
MKNLFISVISSSTVIMILCIILFFILLPSCNYQEQYLPIWDFKLKNPKMNSIEEICNWVNTNIEYKGTGNNWQTPEETYNGMSGICSDKAIFEMSIIYHQLQHKKPNFLIIDYNGQDHSVIEYNGKIYNNNGERLYSVTVYERIAFDILPYRMRRRF